MKGNLSDYLESYLITSDYRFTSTGEYNEGTLRLVHTPSGLNPLTFDVPYLVTPSNPSISLARISILSTNGLSETITTNINQETLINVLHGQKIKSNTNTQLLYKFADASDGVYIYASSTALEFTLLDVTKTNETPFLLETATQTGSTFTGTVNSTGYIRIKYTLYGVSTFVDIMYRIVEI